MTRKPLSSRRRALTQRQPDDGPVRRPSQGRGEQILVTAAELFYEKGYSRTSMADVAELVGILPGSLYHYVESKEDLLFRIIQRAHIALDEQMLALNLSEMDPLEALRTYIQVHVQVICENLTYGILSSTDSRELDPQRQRQVEVLRKNYQSMVLDLVRRGQAAGVLCGQIDPVLSSLALTSIANSVTTWFQPGRERWTPEVIGEQFAEMAVKGLQCDHDPTCSK